MIGIIIMIDYESMSDLQINKLVAEKIGLIFRDDDLDYRSEYPSTLWCASHEFGNQIEPWEQKNFILTPDDAWPIMVKNKISLISLKNEWLVCSDACFQTVCLSPDGSDNGVSVFSASIHVFDAEPLRAAMIVFLKMKG